MDEIGKVLGIEGITCQILNCLKDMSGVGHFGTGDLQSTTPPNFIISYEIFKQQAYNLRLLCVL